MLKKRSIATVFKESLSLCPQETENLVKNGLSLVHWENLGGAGGEGGGRGDQDGEHM